MTRGCWNSLHEVGAVNPSEEVDPPGKAQGLLPLDPTHGCPVTHVTAAMELKQAQAGEDATRQGR